MVDPYRYRFFSVRMASTGRGPNFVGGRCGVLCQSCRYYQRPETAVITRLTGDTGGRGGLPTTLNRDLLHAASDIEQEIQKAAEHEVQVKLQRHRQNEGVGAGFDATDHEWPFRPAYSDYCAVDANQGRYYIPTLHCRPGCGYEPVTPAARTCETCRHRNPARGVERDRRIRRRLIELAGRDAAVGNARGAPLHDSFIESAGKRRALELTSAMHSRGYVQGELEYVDTCERAAVDNLGSHIVCAVANPNNNCPLWEQSYVR